MIIRSNELLQDVFDNILTNAVKYDNNAKIEIDILHELVDDNAYWKLEFRDRGVGVPDANKELVFHRMARCSDSVHGMGLGLTIVNEIVRRSDGRIWVEDRVKGDSSKGSNFVVMLPKGK